MCTLQVLLQFRSISACQLVIIHFSILRFDFEKKNTKEIQNIHNSKLAHAEFKSWPTRSSYPLAISPLLSFTISRNVELLCWKIYFHIFHKTSSILPNNTFTVNFSRKANILKHRVHYRYSYMCKGWWWYFQIEWMNIQSICVILREEAYRLIQQIQIQHGFENSDE